MLWSVQKWVFLFVRVWSFSLSLWVSSFLFFQNRWFINWVLSSHIKLWKWLIVFNPCSVIQIDLMTFTDISKNALLWSFFLRNLFRPSPFSKFKMLLFWILCGIWSDCWFLRLQWRRNYDRNWVLLCILLSSDSDSLWWMLCRKTFLLLQFQIPLFKIARFF